MHATRDIGPEQTICTIPLKCLITVEMGKSTDIGRAIQLHSLALDAPKHVFVMVFMAELVVLVLVMVFMAVFVVLVLVMAMLVVLVLVMVVMTVLVMLVLVMIVMPMFVMLAMIVMVMRIERSAFAEVQGQQPMAFHQ